MKYKKTVEKRHTRLRQDYNHELNMRNGEAGGPVKLGGLSSSPQDGYNDLKESLMA